MKDLIALVALAGLLLLTGCQDNPTTSDSVQIEGEYNGTFTITYHVGTDSARTETGAVEFSFDDGRYDVDGEQRYLPPRGGGKYTIGSSINLTDRELHTAEFDWSLILNGSFDYEMKENTLTMTQLSEDRNRHREIVLQRTGE